jgi:hypothetical protein
MVTLHCNDTTCCKVPECYIMKNRTYKNLEPCHLAMIVVLEAKLRYLTRYTDEATDCKPKNRGSIPTTELLFSVQKV